MWWYLSEAQPSKAEVTGGFGATHAIQGPGQDAVAKVLPRWNPCGSFQRRSGSRGSGGAWPSV
ncbi:hypothetical protein AHIS1636_32040 [Arthrobacter mangrovi]|uniref:Uncharacterized protein n=1 Tax=Arthrobacter mangrovi TaxID=2966350 RepID=A0ABQ5MYK0_9MICC|nr:hypothetical protein AHIS1636_32040 [Arthrobacter mangrovi]